MAENKGILAILFVFLLVLALKPSLIGTSAGAIGLQDFENIWRGLGLPIQMVMFVIVFIVIIALLIGNKKT